VATCFVVMGFHKKTDFQTGRTLDLDKSYRLLIKPAVEECGLTCVRADEIPHSGTIDVPMYEQLLAADIVIADISTSNPNALYELGVRHALRPFSTVVIAESKLQYPFDVNHTAILNYQHLGDAIDYDEVVRFRQQLKKVVSEVMANRQKDSPVYTFLPSLTPPAANTATRALKEVAPTDTGAARLQSSAEFITQANAALEAGDFLTARTLLKAVHDLRPSDRPWTSNDDYVVQRLIVATYKSALPDALAALNDAFRLLQLLNPSMSNDTETLGLCGSIAKRLWDRTEQQPHLDLAIHAYERGFYLRNDYYNGINLAFLLNVRASISQPVDAIADFVQANRIRQQVIRICRNAIDGYDENAPPGTGGGFTTRETSHVETRYWLRAALAEAYFALGDLAEAERWRAEGAALGVPQWMINSTTEQLNKLQALIKDSPLRFMTVS
jgi:tetratricopeptide (TPR) repeat protein